MSRVRAGETTPLLRDVVEMALAHSVGDEVERAYRKGDALEKRRNLKDAWAGYLSREPGGKVVELRRADPEPKIPRRRVASRAS